MSTPRFVRSTSHYSLIQVSGQAASELQGEGTGWRVKSRRPPVLAYYVAGGLPGGLVASGRCGLDAHLAPRLVEGEGSEQSACLPGLHLLGPKTESMCFLGEKPRSRRLGGHVARRAATCISCDMRFSQPLRVRVDSR